MDPDKILEAYVGLTRISCIKISAPWAKGAQNGSKKGVCFFVMDTVYSQFFVTGQTGIKFGQRTSFSVLYWTLTEEFWKFSLKGDFATKPPFLHCFDGCVTGQQIRDYIFRLS